MTNLDKSGGSPDPGGRGAKVQPYFKIGALGLLVVFLMIPLTLIDQLTTDRASLRAKVVAEIGGAWGAPQRIVGPFLVVPYRKGDKGDMEFLVILPTKLSAAAALTPDERYRGIYRTTVYNATARFTGVFELPDIATLGIAADALELSKAYLSLGISDPRNLAVGTATLNGAQLDFQANSRVGGLARGIHAVLANANETLGRSKAVPFALELRLTGRQRFLLSPVGRDTKVRIISSWRHPSFGGRYLPRSRKIGENGFDAQWRVSHLGRDFPVAWTREANRRGTEPQGSRFMTAVDRSMIGVSLVTPVDFYQKTERATKYGILLIILVVAAIFIFEVVGRIRFHPIEYGFVGLTLVMFYLLLLSFAEVLGFASAFLLAAVMAVSTISAYAATVLRSWRRGLILGALVSAAYGNSFVLLQLEDFALIAGATGLFAVLIIVMFATRNIDWATFSDRRQVVAPEDGQASG